jgi:hypothetical protein
MTLRKQIGERKKFRQNSFHTLQLQLTAYTANAVILELYIPEKDLAKTRSQISFIYYTAKLGPIGSEYITPKRV